MIKQLKWLGDEQRLFLERGYLQNGQTPEERYKKICDTVQFWCDTNEVRNLDSMLMFNDLREGKESFNYTTDGIGKRFEKYIENGWVSFASPVLSNFGEINGLPISCVSKDTWINTVEGGKQAKDIVKGDKVLTHKGRYMPITDIILTEKKADIYKLKVSNRMTELKITGNHPVLTNLGWVKVEDLNPDIHLVAINGDLVDTEYFNYTINLKDFVTYDYKIEDKKIKSTSNLNYSSPNAFIDIDNDLAWAIGLWFADGSISKNNNGVPNGIRITQSKEETEQINKWFNIIKNKFNLNGNIYDSKVNRDSYISKRGFSEWKSCNINGIVIGNYFKSFGESSLTKKIPDYILNLPKEKLQYFLDGLLNGDGSMDKYGANNLTLANPELLLQVYKIGLILGHQMSLQMQIKPSELGKTKHVYRISFRKYKQGSSKHISNSAIKFNDGLYYSPIKKLEKTDLIEDVYDFTVEEDHSFSCAGIVVHNCNHGKLTDSLDSILGGMHEVGMLAKYGAGTAKNFSNIRPIGAPITTGGKSEGVMEWIELYAHTMSKVTQGNIRRGFLTAYLTVDHPEIMEFLEIGTKKFKKEKAKFFQTITTAVTIPKGWMQKLKEGDKECRKIWSKIHKTRNECGFPYILFEENCNQNHSEIYKLKDVWIDNANICIEAIEYCDEFKEFACCLSSVVAYYFDDWKDDPYFLKDMYVMLDCVIEEYIYKGKKLKGLAKAVKFAEEHRAIGLGVLGFHSLLQKKNIVFGSLQSYGVNNELFKLMREQGEQATKYMAFAWGVPKYMQGYLVRRNTSLMAQAPTKSTAFIVGFQKSLTEGIEVRKSNYNEMDKAKIQVENKNYELGKVLDSLNMNTKKVWRSILEHNGSVQHLDFLTDHQKAVFRTFSEVSQVDVIKLAAQRQKYIDMGQSLNLMIHPDTHPRDINKLYLLAYDEGVKSLYYQYSINAAQQFNQELLQCSACEG